MSLLARRLPVIAAISRCIQGQSACCSLDVASSTACRFTAPFSTGATTPGEKILAGVVFERLPVVVPEEPQWEIDYQRWREEFRRREYKTLPNEFLIPKKDEQDESVTPWEPAPRITEADRKDDRKSLQRKLDERLFLVVKPGGSQQWRFPQTEPRSGESIRAAAERALSETVKQEEGLKIYFVGNAPGAHFPSSEGTIFYLRCQLIKGVPRLTSEFTDFAWIRKAEVAEYLEQPGLQDVMRKYF